MTRDWMVYASCRGLDPDLFFPESTGRTAQLQVQRAALICRGCPVLVECGLYQQATNSGDGVWAGQVKRSARGISHGGPRPNRASS